ncbi:hypothetical protein [Nonomuraea sp. NPDC001699]
MRVWRVLISAVVLLLAGVVPAQADALADSPTVSATPIGMEPPSYNGLCWAGVPFTATIAITADGPGTVSFRWAWGTWDWSQVVFTEAGTKTVSTSPIKMYRGTGPQSLTIRVSGANTTTAVVPYEIGCTDPVLGAPQIQPAKDYIGRCGSDVVHTVSAQISSPIAQTVRYRWLDGWEQPLPGVDAGEREVVFTEPGTKTVSTPLQRVPLPGNSWNDVELQIDSPNNDQSALYFRTVCVKAEFTSMTRTAGNCKTGAAFKFKLDGYIESNKIGEMAYAWAHQESLDADWVRDPWTPMSFISTNSPGRQNVTRTWTAPGDGLGAWRLEILGSNGTVVSQPLTYYVPCGL